MREYFKQIIVTLFLFTVIPLVIIVIYAVWPFITETFTIFDFDGKSTSVQNNHDFYMQTLHHRFNYAASDCAARVIATNKGAKNAAAILRPNHKDSYMVNKCRQNDKHVVVELCQDIRIDVFTMANLEYFSSNTAKFSLWVSKQIPTPWNGVNWLHLASFTASDSKGEQAFEIPSNRQTAYYKYVKIQLETNYGNDYYCAMTAIRIYGWTMMDDYHNDGEELDHCHLPLSLNPIQNNLYSSSPQNPNFYKGIQAQVRALENHISKMDKNNSNNSLYWIFGFVCLFQCLFLVIFILYIWIDRRIREQKPSFITFRAPTKTQSEILDLHPLDGGGTPLLLSDEEADTIN